MASGRVLHAHHGDLEVLRYEGDIRYPLAPSIEKFVDGVLGEGGSDGMLVDLTETASIDSTNLGLLARVANRLQARDGSRVTIVSHGDIKELLESMGFDEVFDLVEEEAPSATAEIPPVVPAADDLARVMLETHRTLMDMNDENRAQFQDVVRLMEQETSVGE